MAEHDARGEVDVDHVWSALAQVRPRSGAPGFEGDEVGAFMSVLVLARDHGAASAFVAEAMDEHECDLVQLEEFERLDDLVTRGEVDAGLADWAADLDETRRVFCHGTFHSWTEEDEDDA